jgi:hypothetical protein
MDVLAVSGICTHTFNRDSTTFIAAIIQIKETWPLVHLLSPLQVLLYRGAFVRTSQSDSFIAFDLRRVLLTNGAPGLCKSTTFQLVLRFSQGKTVCRIW